MNKLILCLVIATFSLLATNAQTSSAVPKQWTEQGPRGITILKRDTNGDGKVDYERHTSARGLLIYEAMDFNHDGKMDTFYYFNAQGVLERQEIDTTGDGKIDIKITLRDGAFIESVWKDPAVHNKPKKAAEPKAQKAS